ncbi:MAG: hypothetical protein KC418_21440, partial [Anaerolineales bacterium]|nr:hypothetical protein [Anaerolineales bacterium]
MRPSPRAPRQQGQQSRGQQQENGGRVRALSREFRQIDGCGSGDDDFTVVFVSDVAQDIAGNVAIPTI